MPNKINRRSLLKGAAAAAAGTGAALLAPGMVGASARSLALPQAPASGHGGPATDQSKVTAWRPVELSKRAEIVSSGIGINFRAYQGYDFKAALPGTTYGFVGQYPAISQTTGSLSFFSKAIEVPDGAVITEAYFVLLANDSNQATIQVNDQFTILQSASGVTGSSPVFVPIPMPAPVVVDHSVTGAFDTYSLGWVPGTAASTHQLYEAGVGFYNESRLLPFSAPQRLVDGNQTVAGFSGRFTKGVTYGPFDATKQIAPNGAISNSSVPAGAQAVFAAVQSYTPGVLTLFPDGATDPGIANYSGTGTLGTGLNIVYMLLPLSSAGKFKIHSYITGDVYVDAWGFLS